MLPAVSIMAYFYVHTSLPRWGVWFSIVLSYGISGVVQRLSVNDCIHRQASHKYAPIV